MSLASLPRLMNAAGFGGWVCRPAWRGLLDGFLTNPLSRQKRTPARPPRYAEAAGSILLHTGHPNPGLRAALRRYADAWARSPVPVWVHLLADEALAEALDLLEESGAAAGAEVRLPPGCDAQTARRIVRAAWGKLPLLVQIPWENAAALAEAVFETAEVPVSLGAPRGVRYLERGGSLHGRVYGRALLPQALALVESISGRGIPVVGAGGAVTPQDVDAFFQAGAAGVQVDTVLWRGGFSVPSGWSPGRR